MPYYPLSQIETDLYTNGEEYALISDIPQNNQIKKATNTYKGPYFKVSSGKVFSGKVPTNQSIELIPINPVNGQLIENEQVILDKPSTKIVEIVNEFKTDDSSLYDSKNNVIYRANTSNYTSNSKSRIIPSSYYPFLSQKQKDEDQFTRYFTKRTNELRYIEIDKKTYDALESRNSNIAWDLYEPASLIWKIKGDKQEIHTSNKAATISVEQKSRWPGFSKYFKDKYTQFYQNPEAKENLYTNGGEFKTPNGREYMGPYHIHPENGAMVGATHVKKKHDLLTPINPQITSPVTSSQPPPQRPSTPSTGGGGYSGGGY